MRWESLFADLEAQLQQADALALDAEVADRTRRELAAVRLADRLRSHAGAALSVSLVSGTTVRGSVLDVGSQWLLLAEEGGQALVPLAAVAGVSGLSRAVAPPAGAVAGRLGLGHVLRAVARDRQPVRLELTAAQVLTGTVDRVAADHLDLAEHPVGEQRRAAAVASVRAVPFAALALVRST